MIVTSHFVMINYPKTGSTFARTMLRRLYRDDVWSVRNSRRAARCLGWQPKFEQIMLRQNFLTDIAAAVNPAIRQHGAVCQIPERHRNKPMVTIVRDPFSRLVSLYEFRDWVRQPFPSSEILKSHFPHFPNLSFEDFIKMTCEIGPRYSQPPEMNLDIGPLTTQFIRFYAHNPMEAILSLSEETNFQKWHISNFPDLTFLHMESLNDDLFNFLEKIGFSEKKLILFALKRQFLLQKGQKENISRVIWWIALFGRSASFFGYFRNIIQRLIPTALKFDPRFEILKKETSIHDRIATTSPTTAPSNLGNIPAVP